MDSESGFGRFWKELRRRRVVRTGGVYVAAAFVALQVGEIILPAFNTPDWGLQVLVVFAALGLPVVLAVAWVYDVTPTGLERTSGAERPEKGAYLPRLALLVVTTVMVAFAALWFTQMAIGGSAADGAARGVESFVSLDPDAPITAIAVLPLDDYAEGDDFFAAQLHEEIIARLSEMTSLRVVSRTSVQRYATTDKLLPEIAQELRVQAIVEGSVTKPADSDSVRITIQLIHAPSDTHLMSRSYERELKDILRLQSEVAQEIVRAIQGEVESGGMPAVENIATVDPEAHRAFLQGRAALDEGTSEGLLSALEHFGRAIRIDSSFSAPHTAIAGAQMLRAIGGDAPLAQVLAEAHAEIQHAAALGELDDEAEAVMVMIQDQLDRVPEDVRESLAIAPMESDSFTRTYVETFTDIGRRAALATRSRQLGGGPARPPISRMMSAQRLIAGGEFEAAATLFEEILEEDPGMVAAWDALERTHVLRGDYAAAVEVRKERIRATRGDTPDSRASITSLTRDFDPDDPRTYWRWLREDHSDQRSRGEYASDVEYAAACVALGEYEDAIRYLETALEKRDMALFTLPTDPTWDPLREDPRFGEIARNVRNAISRRRTPPPPRTGDRTEARRRGSDPS